MEIHALLLAAGSSERFGDIKQLSEIKSRALPTFNSKYIVDVADKNKSGEIQSSTMIQIVCKQYAQANFDAVTCVLGANAKKIKLSLLPEPSDVKKTNTTIAVNWHMGMGASIAHGMSTLPDTVSHVCIGLGDQIAITHTHLNRLILAAKNNPEMIISCQFDNNHGAPCIFPADFFSALTNLKKDIGARNILRKYPHRVVSVDIPQAAIDIDTKQDLQDYLLV